MENPAPYSFETQRQELIEAMLNNRDAYHQFTKRYYDGIIWGGWQYKLTQAYFEDLLDE